MGDASPSGRSRLAAAIWRAKSVASGDWSRGDSRARESARFWQRADARAAATSRGLASCLRSVSLSRGDAALPQPASAGTSRCGVTAGQALRRATG